MPALVLDLLKYVFLAVLYIFVARAVRAVYLEMRPAVVGGGTRSPAARAQTRKPKKAPRKLAVLEGEGIKGRSLDLGEELVIGRAERCHLILDDTYVSQVHARIFAQGDGFAVEDLGSTNGTYLNRTRVTAPTELQRGDRIKIGKIVMELRK